MSLKTEFDTVGEGGYTRLVRESKMGIPAWVGVIASLTLSQGISSARVQSTAASATIQASNLVRSEDNELERAIVRLGVKVVFSTRGRPLVWLGLPRLVENLGVERSEVAIEQPDGIRLPAAENFTVEINWDASDEFEKPLGYPSHSYLHELLGVVIPIRVKKNVGSAVAGEIIFVTFPAAGPGGFVVLREKGKEAQPAPPSDQVVAVQPRCRSPEEVEAVRAIFNSPGPDARIKAGQELLARFPETEFKTVALQVITVSYQEKNDHLNMMFYAQRTLEADPRSYTAMLMLAQGLAQYTLESDPNREDKLARAERYARTAIELVKAAPKPRPNLPDKEWDAARRNFISQGHEALGLAAMGRKKYDVAVAEFETAAKAAATSDVKLEVELAAAYNRTGRYDEAIAILNRVLPAANLHPMIRQFAQAERTWAVQNRPPGPAPETIPVPVAAREINEGLIVAAAEGDLARVRALLAQGADVNSRGKDDWTPLMAAAYSGQAEVVRALLERGADPNAIAQNERNALRMASELGWLEVVKILLAKGADVNAKRGDGVNAVMVSAQTGHAQVVSALLASGADANAADNLGTTGLMVAAHYGHVDVVRTMLDHGANPNLKRNDGATALVLATQCTERAFWAAHGTTVTIPPIHAPQAPPPELVGLRERLKASLEVARQKHTEIVVLLISHGAEVNARQSDGKSALLTATREGHTSMVEALLAKGADVNVKDNDGLSPLMAAAAAGNTDIVKALLGRGADVSATDKNGLTALRHATQKNHWDIAQMLKKAGARR